MLNRPGGIGVPGIGLIDDFPLRQCRVLLGESQIPERKDDNETQQRNVEDSRPCRAAAHR